MARPTTHELRTTSGELRGSRDDVDRGTDEVSLPHERLEVYRIALELNAVLLSIVPKRGCRDLKEQLERAANSIVLNIAEGSGRFRSADKRHFFDIARGSAAEVAAVVDIMRLRGSAPHPDCRAARNLAVRVVQMLSKLSSSLR